MQSRFQWLCAGTEISQVSPQTLQRLGWLPTASLGELPRCGCARPAAERSFQQWRGASSSPEENKNSEATWDGAFLLPSPTSVPPLLLM